MRLTHTTLDGVEVTVKIKGSETGKKSGLHTLARGIIDDTFPLASIIEEAEIKLLSAYSNPIFFDFFIPVSRLFIEVQGQQHYTYSSFFHKNKRAFHKHLMRDRNKKEWCELNDYRLLELRYDEKDQWETQILSMK